MPVEPRVRVESARNGSPTLVLNGRYLHSRHDPEREALRAVDSIARRDPPVVLILGLGLGYHADTVLQRTHTTRLIVFEPCAEVVRLAREHGLLHRMEAESRFTLAESTLQLQSLLPEIATESLERFEAPGRASDPLFDEARAVVAAFGSRLEINAATLNRFGRLWVRNLCRNVDRIASGRGVDELRGSFADVPVLLLAAGPTLDRILNMLPELARRFLVVAVDTAVAPAIRAGAPPDFAVVVDPQYWNARHLDRVTAATTILVSEASAHPTVFRRFSEPVFLCSSVFPLGREFEQTIGRFGSLGAGGSVSTTAWDFARLLGAPQVVVAGLDLGFPLGRTHCRSSFFEHLAVVLGTRTSPGESVVFRYVWSAEPRQIPANDGSMLVTDRRMDVYRNWFSQQLGLTGSPRTSAITLGGAAVQGLEQITLEVALGEPDRRAEIRKRTAAIRAMVRDDADVRLKTLHARAAVLQTMLEELAGLAGQAASVLAGLRSDHANGRRVDFSAMQPLDRQLASHPGGALGSFLMQDAIGRIRSGFGSASIAEQIEASEAIYGGLEEAARFHASEIHLTLSRSR